MLLEVQCNIMWSVARQRWMVGKQQVLAEWLCLPPNYIIASGRNMYN